VSAAAVIIKKTATKGKFTVCLLLVYGAMRIMRETAATGGSSALLEIIEVLHKYDERSCDVQTGLRHMWRRE
jgi:hypothetical protein